MARSKLTDRDREQLVELYRTTNTTLQGLADRFSVSYSTASRIVKEAIPAKEYQALVKAKRAGGDRKSAAAVAEPEATQPSLLDSVTPPDSLADAPESTPQEDPSPPSEAAIDEDIEIAEEGASEEEGEVDEDIETESEEDDEFADEFEDTSEEEASIAAELMDDEDEDEDDINAAMDDDSDDDEDDTDDDSEEDFDDGSEEDDATVDVTVRDLEDIDLPQRIYAVVDRFQELSSAPLADFKHLGTIPDDLARATTLPVFDEHRVARRFADRAKRHDRQKNRPIAFPAHFVWVTRSQLRAKGIEYLLYDGQIYAL
ncbi:MAG: hypothetical protein AAFX40_11855 [Cyanobacteria bacterium J06639_1]